MKQKNSDAGTIVATLAFGFGLLLLSGCATGGSSGTGENGVTETFSKNEGVYMDPSYEGTNRRASQTHPTPFR